jgi:hypothetical protein
MRRTSFKNLNDALRINALSSFLGAASQLNGLLVCVAVERAYSLSGTLAHPPLQHDWSSATLEKLLQICVFGGAFVDGLRGATQMLHWITDDDAIVATNAAQQDAGMLMGGILRKYPNEEFHFGLGIASKFQDDRRAEDLVAIPDLAAGACSETLSQMGKENMPTSGTGPLGIALVPQIKTSVINVWRSQRGKRLRHLDVVVRVAEDGQTLFSYGLPFVRLPRPGESTEGTPTPNAKWRRAFEAYLKENGVDPVQTLKSMGIDPENDVS